VCALTMSRTPSAMCISDGGDNMANRWLSPEIRFAAGVVMDSKTGCWNWVRGNVKNYGRFTLNGVKVLVHHYTYQKTYGTIPDGLELDHLCRNPRCCNPAHLEAITHQENVARGNVAIANGIRGRMVTECLNGHSYTPENTYTHRNMRSCKVCRRAKNREWQRRSKEVRSAI
jgi:hypothetical protein